jgi:aspartate aminotransferase
MTIQGILFDAVNIISHILYKVLFSKAVIINSPNNPTGVVYNEETIKKIASILNRKSQEYNHSIYLISDEPYRELVYGEVEVPFISKYYNNTIICYSFSKSLSLPGERIGYIVVSEKCLECEKVYLAICGAGRALGFVCAPALFQYMIPSCLGKTSDLSVYKTNRDLLYNALTSYGYEVVKPDGAFYLFVKALGGDANRFSELAKKYELLLVPSDSFGYFGYVRIAYCVSTKQVEASLPAFKKLIEEYQK